MGIYSLAGVPRFKARHDGRLYSPMDFINPSNPEVIRIANQVRADGVLASLRNALHWVSSNISYKPDVGEFFRYPSETLKGEGDCEDLALLLSSICENFTDDIYTCFGTYRGIPHAWNIYLGEGTVWTLDATGDLMARGIVDGYQPRFYFTDRTFRKAIDPLYKLTRGM